MQCFWCSFSMLCSISAIAGGAICGNRCCAEWLQWYELVHLREYLSQMFYYVVLMLMPVYSSTKLQGWKAVFERLVFHGNDQSHIEFWLVFQCLHQLCWCVKQPPNKKKMTVECFHSKMVKFTVPLEAFDFSDFNGSIALVFLAWKQNDSPSGRSSVWFDCGDCGKRGSSAFRWWGNIFSVGQNIVRNKL